MNEKEVREQFLLDAANHRVEIIKDGGLYRHVRFSREASNVYQFDLITWPGHLSISGDMGDYTFCRIKDMFMFFRADEGTEAKNIKVEPGYWEEKCVSSCTASGIKKFSGERFREAVSEIRKSLIDDFGSYETDELEGKIEELDDLLKAEPDSEYEAYQILGDVSYDYLDCDLKEYDYGFIWILHAIVWGILKYDEHKLEINHD